MWPWDTQLKLQSNVGLEDYLTFYLGEGSKSRRLSELATWCIPSVIKQPCKKNVGKPYTVWPHKLLYSPTRCWYLLHALTVWRSSKTRSCSIYIEISGGGACNKILRLDVELQVSWITLDRTWRICFIYAGLVPWWSSKRGRHFLSPKKRPVHSWKMVGPKVWKLWCGKYHDGHGTKELVRR